MNTTYDVVLPRSSNAVFPSRCAVCNHPNPSKKIRLGSGFIGSSWVSFNPRNVVVVKAPACPPCAAKLWRQKLIAGTLTVASLAAVIWFAWPWINSFESRGLRKLATAGVGVACFVPLFLIEFFFPKSFNITTLDNKVTYEFSSHKYAEDFVSLNPGAEWVQSGEPATEESA